MAGSLVSGRVDHIRVAKTNKDLSVASVLANCLRRVKMQKVDFLRQYHGLMALPKADIEFTMDCGVAQMQ